MEKENKLFNELVKETKNKYYIYGEYVEIINEIEKLFDKQSLHLIIFDDLIKDSQNELNRLFDFLNIEKRTINFKKINSDDDWKSIYNASVEIDEKSINTLKEHYKLYNERLYKHIGKDLGWNH